MTVTLDIFIITWNRASFLSRTLEKLASSPFAQCRLTILDNCSSDDTASVCACWMQSFPDSRVIHRAKNIGGNANYLRAVEEATADYTWVLCDDDDLDFTAAAECLTALSKSEYDIVCVGSPHLYEWEYGLSCNVHQLIERGARYYRNLGFFPATIFRTVLFDSNCLLKGYSNINNFYPQIEFVNKSVRENFRVYTCSIPIVLRNRDNSSGFSGLNWFASWVNTCQTITDSRLRFHVINQVLEEEGGRVKMIFIYLCGEKLMSVYSWQTYKRYLTDIFLGIDTLNRLIFCLALPCTLMPRWALKLLRRIRWYLSDEIPPLIDFDRRDLHSSE